MPAGAAAQEGLLLPAERLLDLRLRPSGLGGVGAQTELAGRQAGGTRPAPVGPSHTALGVERAAVVGEAGRKGVPVRAVQTFLDVVRAPVAFGEVEHDQDVGEKALRPWVQAAPAGRRGDPQVVLAVALRVGRSGPHVVDGTVLVGPEELFRVSRLQGQGHQITRFGDERVEDLADVTVVRPAGRRGAVCAARYREPSGDRPHGLDGSAGRRGDVRRGAGRRRRGAVPVLPLAGPGRTPDGVGELPQTQCVEQAQLRVPGTAGDEHPLRLPHQVGPGLLVDVRVPSPAVRRVLEALGHGVLQEERQVRLAGPGGRQEGVRPSGRGGQVPQPEVQPLLRLVAVLVGDGPEEHGNEPGPQGEVAPLRGTALLVLPHEPVVPLLPPRRRPRVGGVAGVRFLEPGGVVVVQLPLGLAGPRQVLLHGIGSEGEPRPQALEGRVTAGGQLMRDRGPDRMGGLVRADPEEALVREVRSRGRLPRERTALPAATLPFAQSGSEAPHQPEFRVLDGPLIALGVQVRPLFVEVPGQLLLYRRRVDTVDLQGRGVQVEVLRVVPVRRGLPKQPSQVRWRSPAAEKTPGPALIRPDGRLGGGGRRTVTGEQHQGDEQFPGRARAVQSRFDDGGDPVGLHLAQQPVTQVRLDDAVGEADLVLVAPHQPEELCVGGVPRQLGVALVGVFQGIGPGRRLADLPAQHTPYRLSLRGGDDRTEHVLPAAGRRLPGSLRVAQVVQIGADEVVERHLDAVLHQPETGQRRHHPQGLAAFLPVHHQLVAHESVLQGLAVGVDEPEPDGGAVVAACVQPAVLLAERQMLQQAALLQQPGDPQVDRRFRDLGGLHHPVQPAFVRLAWFADQVLQGRLPAQRLQGGDRGPGALQRRVRARGDDHGEVLTVRPVYGPPDDVVAVLPVPLVEEGLLQAVGDDHGLVVEPQLPPRLVDVAAGEHSLVRHFREAAPCHPLEVEFAVAVHVTQAQGDGDGGLLRQHPGEFHENGRLAHTHPADQQIGPARPPVTERLGYHLGQFVTADDPVDERSGRGNQVVRLGARLLDELFLGLVVPVEQEDRQEEGARQDGARQGVEGADRLVLAKGFEPGGVEGLQRHPGDQQRRPEEGENAQEAAEGEPPGVPATVRDDALAGLPVGPERAPPPARRPGGPGQPPPRIQREPGGVARPFPSLRTSDDLGGHGVRSLRAAPFGETSWNNSSRRDRMAPPRPASARTSWTSARACASLSMEPLMRRTATRSGRAPRIRAARGVRRRQVRWRTTGRQLRKSRAMRSAVRSSSGPASAMHAETSGSRSVRA